MRWFSRTSAFLVIIGFFSVTLCQGQKARSIPYPNPLQHVVVIFQENRAPDNLFQGLCSPPFGHRHSCSTTPNSHQYNIATKAWLDKNSSTGFTDPEPVPLGNTYDLSHAHMAFLRMYDGGLMDGAGDIACSGTCLASPQFKFVDNSTGILNPYLELAKRYGWANYMFQTNQGPSFRAHQFLFGGSSAPSAADDVAGIFAAENMGAHLGQRDA